MSAPPTLAPPAPAPEPPPAARAAAGDLLPVPVARMIGFVALAGFGGLQWANMVHPAASGALLGSVLASAAAGAVLVAVARRRAPARVRLGATLGAAAVLLLVALVAAGVPRALLDPRGWAELAAGIAQGLGAVSTVRTPYGGLDEWTRIVLVVGGCALAGAAALLAFVPRRARACGFPAAAAVVLGALYTIPVMQHDVRRPWLAGLVFTLLLAGFLWLERVPRRNAGLAAATVGLALLAGYAAAPALDRERALLDYEEIAQSLSPSATTQYRWDHDYGPLDWPRDGREVLRIRARHRSYWKAVNLVAFDGVRWVRGAARDRDPLETPAHDDRWLQTIGVTLRALRTRQFVAAGSTLDILASPRGATSNSPGVYESVGKPLRRGHAYRALVYAPRPTAAQLRAAPAVYPPALPRAYRVVGLPAAAPGRPSAVVFPAWGEGGSPALLGGSGTDARSLIAASPYRRVYALARRLRARAATPYAYVRAVERHLARGFRYTETPPRSDAPLAAFLLRDRAGYCQQFSGAMALLLRMGGVPARVASGFSPGSLDVERDEHVVRDVDAHSWVEVYVTGIGWVARDPTPSDAPARTQTADLSGGADEQAASFAGSERALERTPGGGLADVPATAAPSDDGAPTLVLVGAIALALAAPAGALLIVRRRRSRRPAAGVDAELAELRRALRRSGRVPPPQLTLDALADRLAGSSAKGYVRTLAAARYGYGRGRPTRAQRAALRNELGAGLGLRGRLRAWWALPPKPTRRPAG